MTCTDLYCACLQFLSDQAERTLIVVSAMGTPGKGIPKVTDMLYSLVSQAEARSTAYEETLDALLAKHTVSAESIL